jgi:hypothetical protein
LGWGIYNCSKWWKGQGWGLFTLSDEERENAGPLFQMVLQKTEGIELWMILIYDLVLADLLGGAHEESAGRRGGEKVKECGKT